MRVPLSEWRFYRARSGTRCMSRRAAGRALRLRARLAAKNSAFAIARTHSARAGGICTFLRAFCDAAWPCCGNVIRERNFKQAAGQPPASLGGTWQSKFRNYCKTKRCPPGPRSRPQHPSTQLAGASTAAGSARHPPALPPPPRARAARLRARREQPGPCGSSSACRCALDARLRPPTS